MYRAYSESKQPEKVKDNELFAQQKMTAVRTHMNYLNFHIFRD